MSRSFSLFFLALFAGYVSTGCSSTGGDAPPPATPTRERVVQLSSRLVVAELGPAARSLRALAEEHGGYVASSATREGGVSIDLRVPVTDLAALRDQLDQLDPSRTEIETSGDVTAAHADLNARLVSARATEARLLALTAERTPMLSDVLTMETELQRIRDRVEALEGEERALSHSVELAQVHLDLSLEGGGALSDAPLESIRTALVGGARFTFEFALVCVVIGSAVAPMGLVLGALGLLAWLAWRLVGRRLATP